jgi:hypothetical protein
MSSRPAPSNGPAEARTCSDAMTALFQQPTQTAKPDEDVNGHRFLPSYSHRFSAAAVKEED